MITITQDEYNFRWLEGTRLIACMGINPEKAFDEAEKEMKKKYKIHIGSARS